LFRHVAGIELDSEIPGFQRFVLKPFIRAGLGFARATYRSMHGEIESHWIHSGDQLTWSIRVPANTTARVFIPSEPDTLVTESGAPLPSAIGLRTLGNEPGYVVCEAAAGGYTFNSTLRATL
jgi:alpha-L-rhamnosidase